MPSGVLRKAKLADGRSGQGDAKMAAEKKLTTPTTPNPTPPITTHRLQAINSLVIGPIFSKAIAHKDTPSPRTGWPWRFPSSSRMDSHGLLQHLPQWLQHDDNYNRRDALNIMSDLPSSWPGCRLCINADAAATSYLAGLHRLFLEAKLAEKDHQTALQEANARANEMETICLDPLARHLHQLFHTDDDLFFDVYPEEWKQLQRLDFWQLVVQYSAA